MPGNTGCRVARRSRPAGPASAREPSGTGRARCACTHGPGGAPPRRRPLEDVDLGRRVGELHHLQCAGSGPDHGDPLRQLHGVIPARGMEARSCERVCSMDVRDARVCRRRLQRGSVRPRCVIGGLAVQRPVVASKPMLHVGTESECRLQSEVGGGLFEVARSPVAACRYATSRFRAKDSSTGATGRRSAARVRVVSPRTAYAVVPLEHHEIGDARLPQLRGRSDSRTPSR